MESRDEFKEYVLKYFDGKVVLESDDLTIVIRAHLLVENILEKLLKGCLDITVFEERDLSFNLKLKMAQSMNLLEDLYPAIKRLNKIRNDFAHKIETKIETMDISVFIQLYENEGRENDPTWKAALNNKKACFGIVIHYILSRLVSAYDRNQKKRVI